jgi:nucleoid-associated protein YgaU
MKKYLTILILALAASSMALSAQSLIDNPSYQKSLELKAMAVQAFDDGDYDAATEYASQAKEYASLSDQYVEKMVAKAAADKAIAKAKDKMAWADKVNAKALYPEAYGKASEYYDGSLADYDGEDYPSATDKARSVIDTLDGLATLIAAKASVAVKQDLALPAIYVVRLIPERRDCLWRIAEYPFIYNNPTKWPVIYEANKKTFRDPGNPNLIFPGQKLKIPSIKGETRDGTYDPTKTYTPLPKK